MQGKGRQALVPQDAWIQQVRRWGEIYFQLTSRFKLENRYVADMLVCSLKGFRVFHEYWMLGSTWHVKASLCGTRCTSEIRKNIKKDISKSVWKLQSPVISFIHSIKIDQPVNDTFSTEHGNMSVVFVTYFWNGWWTDTIHDLCEVLYSGENLTSYTESTPRASLTYLKLWNG